MIIVVEGISAVGKTTWCAQHGGNQTVPEDPPQQGVPGSAENPVEAARFWAEHNANRWEAALAIERSSSLAICDTDPLKLHYSWCLWQIGGASEREWLESLAATRETFAEQRMGFADLYIVRSIEPEAARTRARADITRRRRNFELHVRLQPALITWYATLNAVLPGRVQFAFPARLPEIVSTASRYDVALFDRMIESLPKLTD